MFKVSPDALMPLGQFAQGREGELSSREGRTDELTFRYVPLLYTGSEFSVAHFVPGQKVDIKGTSYVSLPR